MEILIDKTFMHKIKHDDLFNLDLRSDIENNNIYSCVLRPVDYIGNRPKEFKGQHEDDTWAIDCFTECGNVVGSYLYSSECEYVQDINLLEPFT